RRLTLIHALSLHDALPISFPRPMILPTLLALAHGDDTGIQLLYFWAAVLLALTPLLIFGTIGVWVAAPRPRSRAAEFRYRPRARSEDHTSELQSRFDLVCR